MTPYVLPGMILIPLLATVVVALLPRRVPWLIEIVSVLAVLLEGVAAVMLFPMETTFTMPWLGFGIDFALRADAMARFIALGTAFFGVVLIVYSAVFLRARACRKQFFLYALLSLAMSQGAILAQNLVLMLFCWEGLLVTLFGMIFIGSKQAWHTAVKALVIVGISDLCLMVGIGIVWHLSGTLDMSQIHLQATGLGAVAFVLMMIGAIAKAGAMPFHSWIPDASQDAPLPFMAFMPASLEKLLGISLLARVSLELFAITPESMLSILLMVIGAVTIVAAVLMALIQKDYKKLLSYHAISQVGYMVLGIGTALPVGIVGGLFHMINHALYKSCLFLTGGAVERETGTTDLRVLGGLARNMPLTFACFVIAAASISGVPPFNGFFSKELVYDAALERNWIFYAAALMGSFFTAASFLKLGHSAFLGKRHEEHAKVRETNLFMLIPMIVIAALCVFFGLAHQIPVERLVAPAVASAVPAALGVGALSTKLLLVVVSIVVLGGALLNHLAGVKATGSGLKSSDHLQRAPGLSRFYRLAAHRESDPYDAGRVVIRVFARILWGADRIVDWLYNGFAARGSLVIAAGAARLQAARFSVYILLALTGFGVLLWWMLRF